MKIGDIEVQVPGLGSFSFDCKFDGFGVPCDICGEENAGNRLSGDMPPGIPGTYCDKCRKIVCKKAGDYYREQIKIETKNLKSTVLFRNGGKWSADEVNRLMGRFEEGVWHDEKYPEYLILRGKHRSEKSISKVLDGVTAYVVTYVTGTDKLPFSPF